MEKIFYFAVLGSFLVVPTVFAALSDFVSVEVTNTGNSKVCFYASLYSVKPFDDAGVGQGIKYDNGSATCASLGLPLATIKTPKEQAALTNIMKCQMPNNPDKALIGYDASYTLPAPAPTLNTCYFYLGFGVFTTSTGDNCTTGPNTSPVICRKEASCTTPTDKCNGNCFFGLGLMSYSKAKAACFSAGGHLPTVRSSGRASFLTANYNFAWTSLTRDPPQGQLACGLSGSCTSLNPPLYWEIVSGQKTNVLLAADVSAVSQMIVNSKNCLYLGYVALIGPAIYSSSDCINYPLLFVPVPIQAVCEFESPTLTPTQTANFIDTTLACSAMPTVPSSSKLGTSFKTSPICTGTVISYKCNTTGINAFDYDVTQNTINVTCNPGNPPSYQSPNPWPTCTSYLNCTEPPIDTQVMKYDWTLSKGISPNLTVIYSCVFSKKLILTKTNLDNKQEINMVKTIKTTCKATGVWDIDITAYVCTKPCPIPISPDPSIMYHSWTNITDIAEYMDVLFYTCRNNHKFLTKIDFAAGSSANLFNNLYATCLITGWFNDTSGSHTCTRNCGPPADVSNIMTSNSTNALVVKYNTMFRYQCIKRGKLIVSLTDPNGVLYSSVNVTCLVNGQYDYDITEYYCIDCNRPQSPLNGHFECSSVSYADNSICTLVCDPGYIPSTKVSMTCTPGVNGSDWNVPFSEFTCVKPCHLVLGGVDNQTTYLDDVEVFCPNDACAPLSMPPFPYGVLGPVSGFINGLAIVCGGARTIYTGCTSKNVGNVCSRNAECVGTAGGTQWCTGPKTAACYQYDRYISHTWVASAYSLKTPRVHAASVVLPDGRIWVLGGASSNGILQSTEFIEIDNNQISKIYAGPDMVEPLMGHCVAVVSVTKVIVYGGFSTILNDYTTAARLFDFSTLTWDSKPWMNPGVRMDSACASISLNGLKQAFLAGGWNNSGMLDTAIFAANTQHWIYLNGDYQNGAPLPTPIRSSKMIERNGEAYLIGGVECTTQGGPCTRTNKVLKLKTNGTYGSWIDMTSLRLRTARSSHTVLTVPRTMIPRCF